MSRRPFATPILAAATFLLSACAASPGAAPAGRTSEGRTVRGGGREALRIENETFRTSDVVHATPRRVWEALVATFHDLDLPITEVDQDRRIVIGEGFRLRRLAGRRASYYVDCGTNLTGPVADQSYVTVTLSSVAHEAEGVVGATSLVSEVDASSRARESATGRLHCTSRGKMERLILERVREKIGGG